MDVKIITLHNANNVGAFLQAFSLQTVVQELGHNSSFVKFPASAENKSKLQKILYYVKKGEIKKVLFKRAAFQKYAQTNKLLNKEKEEISEDAEYDAVIVGSDEVWNLESDNFVHYPQYFADKIHAKKIISYAPSANNTSLKTIIDNGYDFSGFTAISARDERTSDLVKEVTKGEIVPEIVCDPTLLISSFAPFIKDIEVTDKNYILVYSYGLPKRIVKEIKDFAKKQNKKLISVGNYNSWCDKNIVADPFEFLVWLRNADFVITSTFHGTVLSTRFNKEFAVYTGVTNNNPSHKLLYFTRQMNLEDRVLQDTGYLDSVHQNKIDYESVNKRINKLRKSSMDFLTASLGG